LGQGYGDGSSAAEPAAARQRPRRQGRLTSRSHPQREGKHIGRRNMRMDRRVQNRTANPERPAPEPPLGLSKVVPVAGRRHAPHKQQSSLKRLAFGEQIESHVARTCECGLAPVRCRPMGRLQDTGIVADKI
jgi:hypothetical protein